MNVHWTVKIRSYSYSKMINELILRICSNNQTNVSLAIEMTQTLKKYQFVNKKNPEKTEWSIRRDKTTYNNFFCDYKGVKLSH